MSSRLTAGPPSRSSHPSGGVPGAPTSRRTQAVGRPAVRDAMSALAQIGLIDLQPGERARVREVEQLRNDGLPTVPTRLDIEKRTNPFLRPDSAGLRAAIGLEGADTVGVFARTRALKDEFRG